MTLREWMKRIWRDQRVWLPAEELWQDVRFGWRVLRRTPSFAVPAALTLALAVASVTSVFTVVDAVLLAPLPYGDPDRVVAVTERYVPQRAADVAVASGNFLAWQARSRTLQAMTAIDGRQHNLTRDGDPQQVDAKAVSDGFGRTIAVEPMLGRLFAPEEFRAGRETVALLSYALWSTRYHGDRAIVGRAIFLDDRRYEVIGVMPAGFVFPSRDAELWVPLVFTAADQENRSGHTLSAIARLGDHVPLEAARREMDAIAAALAIEFPAANRDWGVTLRPARDTFVGDTKPVLAAVSLAVGLLLVVAGANVAGLLLIQGVSRDREISIRTAIGANRARLVRQLLSESVLLAVAGGSLGLALAHVTSPLVAALRPDDLMAWKPIGVDVRAGVFAIGISIVVGALFGALPAIVLSDRRLGQRSSSRFAGSAESRARLVLIGAEVALAILLVCGAAVLARTLERLTKVDVGFRPSSVITMRVSLPVARYGEDHLVTGFYDRTLQRVRALPGVQSAGATHVLPLSGDSSVRPLRIEGQTVSDPRDLPIAHYRVVTDGYLETMGIPLRAGRTFDSRDVAGRPLVVIVNEALQRRAWGSRDPVGTRVSFGGLSGLWAEVVGVVGDVRHFGPTGDSPPEIYWPAAQLGAAPGETLQRLRRNLFLVIAADGDPFAIVPSVRAAVHEIDPDQPIASVRTMASLLGSALWMSRASAWIVAVFGGAALSFALLGIFGAASYTVAQRQRELAVRLALGATASGVRRLVLRGTMIAITTGLVAGLVAALALQRGFSSLIAEARPLDPLTFVAVIAGSTATMLVACWLPARRASRVEPMHVLRME